jgi:hypothetical protein
MRKKNLSGHTYKINPVSKIKHITRFSGYLLLKEKKLKNYIVHDCKLLSSPTRNGTNGSPLFVRTATFAFLKACSCYPLKIYQIIIKYIIFAELLREVRHVNRQISEETYRIKKQNTQLYHSLIHDRAYNRFLKEQVASTQRTYDIRPFFLYFRDQFLFVLIVV